MKKNLLYCAAALLAAGLFSGCGESPTDAVKAWQNAVIAGDVEKANSLCTSNMHTKNKFTIAIMKLERDRNDGPMIRDIKSAKFVEEKIEGEAATVKFHTEKQSDQEITLHKVNGKWLIDSKK